MLVKSDSYKSMGYSCVVLTTAGCCVYTRKLHASNFRIVITKIGFPVQCKDLDSLFNIKQQSEVVKKNLFAGDCRENRLKVLNFLRRSCKDATRYLWGKHDPNDEIVAKKLKCS